MLADIAAKGGNLLLNVGPRGDARIPDAQLTRLGWLADWVVPNADALAATRPWVVPGRTTGEGAPLRYTARDDRVYAFVQDPSGSVTLPDVRSTPTTTATTIDGAPLPWKDTPAGLVVDVPGPASSAEPAVLALGRVEARTSGRAR
jgi:alpha-L-fucosidase